MLEMSRVTTPSRFSKALVTLNGWLPEGGKELSKGTYRMATHSWIDHVIGKPCIFFWKVRECEVVRTIVLESIHHTLVNLDHDLTLDDAWEKFHGLFYAASRLLGLKEAP
jgi:hypothetical protein